MEVTPSGTVKVLMGQFLKASFPIVFNELGKVMSVKPVPENAFFPITSSPSGNVMCNSYEQQSKAALPMAVTRRVLPSMTTVAGIVAVVSCR